MQRSVGRLSALLNPLTYILINIGIVVLIHTGAMRVSLGDLTQGFRAIQMLAANYKPHFIIIKNRHCNATKIITNAHLISRKLNTGCLL